jgi:hypothetical protein
MAQDLQVPAGTKVMLALIGAVQARSAQPGDAIYCETSFPVAIDNRMAIPAGTYWKGNIDILVRPKRLNQQAEFRMHFTQVIFAGGYTITFPDAQSAVAAPTVTVSTRSDVLLDNGTQFEVVLQKSLVLDSVRVAAAVALSKAPNIAHWKTASQCRTIPGTPGTPGTYIPGSPGTPSTTIPGGPGVGPITIPGMPGTPATYIPGSSGSGPIPCPAAPATSSQPVAHKESFSITQPVTAAGRQLLPGTYQASWTGLGPLVQVIIGNHGQVLATLPATVVAASKTPTADPPLRHNPDGSFSLQILQFQGQPFALRFN